jgi:hypothetical protein
MIMTIQNFIDEINSCFPTSDQIIAKYGEVIKGYNSEMAEEYREGNLLQFEDNVQGGDLADELIYNTNIGSVGIGAINFSSEVNVVEERYKELASYNDCYFLCYDITDDSVVIFDQYYEDKEQLAASMEQLFQFLVEYQKYHRNSIFGVDYSKERSRQTIESLIDQGLSKKWVDILMPNR